MAENYEIQEYERLREERIARERAQVDVEPGNPFGRRLRFAAWLVAHGLLTEYAECSHTVPADRPRRPIPPSWEAPARPTVA